MKPFYPILFLLLFSQCRIHAKPEIEPNQKASAIVAQDTASTEDSTKPDAENPASANYYPFELSEIRGTLVISAQIEGKQLYPKYSNLFKKYGYSGNGYCWEGHITQILQKLDRGILKHLDFDSEAGGFFVNADSRATQQKFVELLSPIFSNLDTLSKWIKKADRSKIDD